MLSKWVTEWKEIINSNGEKKLKMSWKKFIKTLKKSNDMKVSTKEFKH